VGLLRTRFVPLAVDVWFEQRRRDPHGEFFRKVVMQREGMRPDRTTQGFYIFSPDGMLIRGWNNRDVTKMRRFLNEASASYRPAPAEAVEGEPDARFARTPPEGGLVLDVFSRILEANWPAPRSPSDEIFRRATGRDRLWITAEEIASLSSGEIPETLSRRIARFHLIDNTRGEPPMWTSAEVRKAELRLVPDRGGFRIEGEIDLETGSGDRGYRSKLLGRIESRNGRLSRFDLVARGEFWGEGTYTKGAPEGRFVLGVAFRIAAEGESARVAPQGAKDLSGYLRP
jgi:hypothetical protein